MTKPTLFILLLMATSSFGQYKDSGPFRQSSDTGSPSSPGSVRYDAQKQTLQLSVAGQQTGKAGHYAFRTLKGDFILTAETDSYALQQGQSAGWLVRGPEESRQPEVLATFSNEGQSSLEWTSDNKNPSAGHGQIPGRKPGYSVLQLERNGNTFIMRCAHSGEPLHETGRTDLENMKQQLTIGLVLSTIGPGITISFRNIRIDRPVPDNHDSEKEGYLNSRLELITIADSHRKVIYEAQGRFEAPNFMPDGKKLLINRDGSLYTIPVGGGTPEKFNTGTANSNNNDHVISFDGKWLGISSHRQGLPGYGSTVYVLPISGGEPRLITPETPSYLHGWSADNKSVVYVAQRNGSNKYHIYRKAIDGGPETQLTFHTKGHVDGPEYSPDGRYIYYNGSQTGTMQLWRMAPDGTGNEQLTFDERNNWFPHLSPDGKWIAYLSFPPSIHPDDHPAYKRVTLNLMPVNGGAPRVIAYLYGGQGTINVPSWSPDSSTVAFVSNSEPNN